MTLTHDKPANPGVENGLKRAMQMTDIRWSPLKPMASSNFFYTAEGKTYAQSFIQPGTPMTGMIYSSVLKNQKFLGYNVSLETFMTATRDPQSVLYKKNLHGTGRNNVGCWYGIVCSCFASYVHDLPNRTICRDWPFVENVTMLGQPDPDEFRLLDIILHTKKHIAVITDILRDSDGHAKLIEVSEATLPKCKRTYFTPEEFRLFWYEREFNIYRRSGLEKITYTPSCFVHIEADPERGISGDPEMPPYPYNTALLPDQGNASNYSAEDEVVIDILEDGWENVVVGRSDKPFDGAGRGIFDEPMKMAEGRFELPIVDGKVVVPVKKPGYYAAVATAKDRCESDPVTWAVAALELKGNKTVYAPGETAEFTFDAPEGVDVFLQNINRVKTSGEMTRAFLSDAEKKAGKFTAAVPAEPGEFFAYVSAKNAYGVYTSNHFTFTVEG